MTKIGRYLFAIILFASLKALALVAVQAKVDSNKVSLGQSLVFTISVISSESVDIVEPRIADIPGFDLANKWEQSAVSQKMVSTDKGMDWQTQRKKEFHYQLSPRKNGRLSIDATEVVVDGKTYRTQPIIIEVGSTAQPKGRQGGGQNQEEEDAFGGGMAWPGVKNFEDLDKLEEDLFNQLLQNRGAGGRRIAPPPPGQVQRRNLPINTNEAFFVQSEVDKSTAFEGEQITVHWYVYTRGNMETLDRVKFPTLRGFWKEVIEEVPTIQFEEEIVNGVSYRKALLASHALFPIKAGKAVIDEYKLKSRVRMPTTYGGGFYGQAYEYTKSSKPTSITVLPLPEEGRPKNFSGAVGKFIVSVRSELQSVPMNQPFSVKIRFEGEGNAKLIELPAMNWPSGLEVYDTKSDAKFFKNGQSFKDFEVLLIARQMGDIEIPPIEVSLFDPQTKKYYTQKSASIKLQVVAAAAQANQAESRMGEPASPTVRPGDVLPPVIILPETSGSLGGMPRNPWVWVAMYLLTFAGLGFFAYTRLANRTKKVGLNQKVQKRYKVVEAAIAANDYRKVGTEMTNIFYLVLGQSSGDGAYVDMEKLLKLLPPSLRRDKGSEIGKYFEIYQVLSFAPDSVIGDLKSKERLVENFENAKNVIRDIVAHTEN